MYVERKYGVKLSELTMYIFLEGGVITLDCLLNCCFYHYHTAKLVPPIMHTLCTSTYIYNM